MLRGSTHLFYRKYRLLIWLLFGVLVSVIFSLLLFSRRGEDNQKRTATILRNGISSLNSDLHQISASTNLPIFYYYPPQGSAISKDYIYKAGSTSASQGVVSFSLYSPDNTPVVITIQKQDAALDPTIYKGRVQVNVQSGHASLGMNESDTTAAIFGTDAVLFLRSNAVIDDATVEAMLASFSTQYK